MKVSREIKTDISYKLKGKTIQQIAKEQQSTFDLEFSTQLPGPSLFSLRFFLSIRLMGLVGRTIIYGTLQPSQPSLGKSIALSFSTFKHTISCVNL